MMFSMFSVCCRGRDRADVPAVSEEFWILGREEEEGRCWMEASGPTVSSVPSLRSEIFPGNDSSMLLEAWTDAALHSFLLELQQINLEVSWGQRSFTNVSSHTA